MYQGKFDAKRKKTSVDVQELVAQRGTAPQKKAAPVQDIPSQEEILTRKNAPKKAAPSVQEVPAKKKPPVPVQEEAPVRKGPRLGGVIFYTFYFMFILLFFVGTHLGLKWVHGWLVDYEAAQPTTKCTQVFEQLFTNPDWSALYDAAGVEDTTYEGKEHFIAYMEAKVGDSELTYMETSAGLSGDKKYIVKLGDEKLASFTLVDITRNADALVDIPDIPEWDLGAIELFYEREESFRIQKLNGHTAYVNNVPLDDSFTIQIATTLAATKYLPKGVSGVSMCTQEITGLMATPTVTIFDDKGQQMEVTYDDATKTFTERTESNTISEEEHSAALNAAKAYALFMIEESSAAKVARHFETSSNIYNIIVKSTPWMQNNNGYKFADESVTEYCRYTDDLFSAKVSMTLNVTRTDGSVKPYTVNSTLFFEKQNTGKWLAFEMTNVDVQQPVGEVRLTFKNGDTVLSSELYPTDSTELVTPMISAPEGKVFSGWVREDVDENGTKTLTVVFKPNETGFVNIPAGTALEPMTLYALFEDAPANATEGA